MSREPDARKHHKLLGPKEARQNASPNSSRHLSPRTFWRGSEPDTAFGRAITSKLEPTLRLSAALAVARSPAHQDDLSKARPPRTRQMSGRRVLFGVGVIERRGSLALATMLSAAAALRAAGRVGTQRVKHHHPSSFAGMHLLWKETASPNWALARFRVGSGQCSSRLGCAALLPLPCWDHRRLRGSERLTEVHEERAHVLPVAGRSPSAERLSVHAAHVGACAQRRKD